MDKKIKIPSYHSASFTLDISTSNCVFCGIKLDVINKEQRSHYKWAYIEYWLQKKCSMCGWWSLDYYSDFEDYKYNPTYSYSSAFGIIERFEIDGIDIPINILQNYLKNNFKSRFDIHPRKLEELMASIFKNLGYQVELTSYSRDGGVDIYLYYSDKSAKPIAVQVKRNKKTRKIGVESIDTFLGTLIRNDIYKGIYVTTSDYTKNAIQVVSSEMLKKKSFFIELWNSNRILDALKSNSTQNLNPENIAWNLKGLMPCEYEKDKDYRLFDDYRMNSLSSNHMEWWNNNIENIMKGKIVNIKLPITLKKNKAIIELNKFESKNCNVWSYMDEKRKSFEYFTGRIFSTYQKSKHTHQMEKKWHINLDIIDPTLVIEIKLSVKSDIGGGSFFTKTNKIREFLGNFR